MCDRNDVVQLTSQEGKKGVWGEGGRQVSPTVGRTDGCYYGGVISKRYMLCFSCSNCC